MKKWIFPIIGTGIVVVGGGIACYVYAKLKCSKKDPIDQLKLSEGKEESKEQILRILSQALISSMDYINCQYRNLTEAKGENVEEVKNICKENHNRNSS